MINEFLQNKHYAFVIAQIAVVFQSVLTILIGICLLFSLAPVIPPVDVLKVLLIIDSIFVVLHLSYRGAYRGQKVVLENVHKKILIIHVVSSLIALIATSMLIHENLNVYTYLIIIVLLVWSISLVSGVMFYSKKYKNNS